jgi:hypothetical protein
MPLDNFRDKGVAVLQATVYHDTHRAEDLSKQLCLGGVCTSKERKERESEGARI